MKHNTEDILNLLITKITKNIVIESIGLSGSKSPLPKAGEGDIDIFIYCREIPNINQREEYINEISNLIDNYKINVFVDENWGVGDLITINGIETWLMFFTISETIENVNSILNGKYLEKIDNYYYPIGRLAMFKNMTILYDKNDFLNSLKNRLNNYPEELANKIIKYHIKELDDVEDLERAVFRKDVLFYHFALDLGLDHFLQTLFALNKIYFPSRKRSLEYIDKFQKRPVDCSNKLLEIINLGGSSKTMAASYELWKKLVFELKLL